ncbi:CCR4-NOT transcription complex subunit 11 [Hypsibius exemplaris]|uniref:CCR4-NOT transcription complex subunit 11 n=1 Tax=Hypsibius exemplaris TaxID=2072580 RepID=A0A1W0WYY1_HYPEX|nr:CCR4-NOT transcription complex subunit 11 [Hypsibius exemplaris]
MAIGAGSSAYDAFLSPKETDDLLTLVCDEPAEGWTFDNIAKNFNLLFPKSDHYRVGKALEMFLLCGVLDKAASQLVSVFLLYDMFKEQSLAANPFASLFYVILHPEQRRNVSADHVNGTGDDIAHHLTRIGSLTDATEWFHLGLAKFSAGSRLFVAELAAGPQAGMFAKPPTFFSNTASVSSSDPVADISQFDKEFLERQERIPVIDRSGVGCIVDYPDVTVTGFRHDGMEAARETANALGSGQKPQPDLAFIPELMRPVPPVMPLSEQELVWMNPRTVEELKLHLDPTMLVIPPKWLHFAQLILKAVGTPLHMDEQSTLLKFYEHDSTLVLGGAVMTVEDILGIVENNPIIATEVFKRVHRLPENALKRTRFKRYLHAFLETNVSVHTMEVINRLHEAKIVPNDFLPLYVSYALRKCDSGPTSESATYNQTRLIRLVCVFLQSAVRNKTLNLAENPDLLVEIQAFCVKQTNVREALALYRCLRSNQNPDSADNFESSSNESSSPSKSNSEKMRK